MSVEEQYPKDFQEFLMQFKTDDEQAVSTSPMPLNKLLNQKPT